MSRFMYNKESLSYMVTCFVFFLVTVLLLVIRSAVTEEFIVEPHQEKIYHPIIDEIQGKTAIIYDIEADRVLAGKDPLALKSIASITKLPAAFIAFSYIDEHDTTVINEEDFALLPNTPLLLNDKWRTLDLLEYSIMTSSNRGVNAVARTVEEKTGKPLVVMMNEFAQKHGLVQTHFLNVTGLDAHDTLAGSESSALDLVRIAGIIVKENNGFAQLTAQKEKEFFSLDGLKYKAENTNELIKFIPETILLSKTGFTNIAGAALMMVIEDRGKNIALLVLDSTHSGRFEDMEILLRIYKELTYGISEAEQSSRVEISKKQTKKTLFEAVSEAEGLAKKQDEEKVFPLEEEDLERLLKNP